MFLKIKAGRADQGCKFPEKLLQAKNADKIERKNIKMEIRNKN